MLRATSFLGLLALGAMAQSQVRAGDLPVIVNGTQVAQATKVQPTAPPTTAKGPLPIIINYPSAIMPPAPANPQAPKPAKAPTRVVFAYNAAAVADDIDPVAYNIYRYGPMLGAYGYGGPGYGISPYAGAYGYSSAYGYSGYGAGLAYTTAIVDLRPPKVEVLDTGIRPNVGRLTSMPAVGAPVYGEVIGVYYR
jgi:hypothetical protein